MTNRAAATRKRQGKTRPLGSWDMCEQCGGAYVVTGGLQRFCPPCGRLHQRAYDRKTALDFYHRHRDRLNDRRNAQRRQRRAQQVWLCQWCGTPLRLKGSRTRYCSLWHRRLMRNWRWRHRYYLHRPKKEEV